MNEIYLNEETKQAILNKIKAKLDAQHTNGDISIYENLDTIPEGTARPRLYITPVAYCKIMMYIRDTSTEIAWHGTVSRNAEDNSYCIKDVFLYPQELSAATVVSDDEKYPTWLETLDDETYNTMRFQGHSHVNFSANPSVTDLDFYRTILGMLPENDYYIFMIMNKSGDMTLIIYDLQQNKVYNKADIDLIIGEDGAQVGINHIITNQKELYCKTPAYTWSKKKTKSGPLAKQLEINSLENEEEEEEALLNYSPHVWEDFDKDNPYAPYQKTINSAKIKGARK